MAFTSVSAVVQNTQPIQHIFKVSQAYPTGGRFFSQWGIGGIPAAGAYANSINGVTLSGPTVGAIDIPNPPSGKDTYIAEVQYNLTTSGIIMFADRLWHNGGMSISNTDVQTITTPAWPSRDQNASANGHGVFIGLEIITGNGTGTPSFTISYTNSEGTSGRTATNLTPTATNPNLGSFFIFELEGGDRGVRSIQSFQQSSPWSAGEFCLVAFKPIAMVDPPGSGFPIKFDPITMTLPKVLPDSVLFTLFCPFNSTTITPIGGLTIAYG